MWKSTDGGERWKLLGIDLALAHAGAACAANDDDNDGVVTVDELVLAVSSALNSYP